MKTVREFRTGDHIPYSANYLTTVYFPTVDIATHFYEVSLLDPEVKRLDSENSPKTCVNCQIASVAPGQRCPVCNGIKNYLHLSLVF